MKNLNDIEKFLKASKQPDKDFTDVKHEIWSLVLQMHKQRRRKSWLSFMKPWMWVLASIFLILICVLFMLLMVRSI